MELINQKIAELAGIFAGDGTLYKTNRSFVMEIRGNKEELPYYFHIKAFAESVFEKPVKIIKRTHENKKYLVGIRVCGKKVYQLFHITLNFPVGKKAHKVKVPPLILNSPKLWKYYIRGIFDSDGSIYVRKSGKNKKYFQPIIDISSVSNIHLIQLKRMLKVLGFNFWMERNKIRIAGWKNVEKFFKEIKPKNNVKLKRYNEIIKLKSKAGVA